ncbi:hypothetical protein ADUPG1_000505, partial [Aduncisulcus paluster]
SSHIFPSLCVSPFSFLASLSSSLCSSLSTCLNVTRTHSIALFLLSKSVSVVDSCIFIIINPSSSLFSPSSVSVALGCLQNIMRIEEAIDIVCERALFVHKTTCNPIQPPEAKPLPSEQTESHIQHQQGRFKKPMGQPQSSFPIDGHRVLLGACLKCVASGCAEIAGASVSLLVVWLGKEGEMREKKRESGRIKAKTDRARMRQKRRHEKRNKRHSHIVSVAKKRLGGDSTSSSSFSLSIGEPEQEGEMYSSSEDTEEGSTGYLNDLDDRSHSDSLEDSLKHSGRGQRNKVEGKKSPIPKSLVSLLSSLVALGMLCDIDEELIEEKERIMTELEAEWAFIGRKQPFKKSPDTKQPPEELLKAKENNTDLKESSTDIPHLKIEQPTSSSSDVRTPQSIPVHPDVPSTSLSPSEGTLSSPLDDDDTIQIMISDVTCKEPEGVDSGVYVTDVGIGGDLSDVTVVPTLEQIQAARVWALHGMYYDSSASQQKMLQNETLSLSQVEDLEKVYEKKDYVRRAMLLAAESDLLETSPFHIKTPQSTSLSPSEGTLSSPLDDDDTIQIMISDVTCKEPEGVDSGVYVTDVGIGGDLSDVTVVPTLEQIQAARVWALHGMYYDSSASQQKMLQNETLSLSQVEDLEKVYEKKDYVRRAMLLAAESDLLETSPFHIKTPQSTSSSFSSRHITHGGRDLSAIDGRRAHSSLEVTRPSLASSSSRRSPRGPYRSSVRTRGAVVTDGVIDVQRKHPSHLIHRSATSLASHHPAPFMGDNVASSPSSRVSYDLPAMSALSPLSSLQRHHYQPQRSGVIDLTSPITPAPPSRTHIDAVSGLSRSPFANRLPDIPKEHSHLHDDRSGSDYVSIHSQPRVLKGHLQPQISIPRSSAPHSLPRALHSMSKPLRIRSKNILAGCVLSQRDKSRK